MSSEWLSDSRSHDVFLNALGLVSVGPGNDDVVRMALRQPVPLLVAEDIEVEHVEDLQMLLDGADFALRLRVLSTRECGGEPDETDCERQGQAGQDAAYALHEWLLSWLRLLRV